MSEASKKSDSMPTPSKNKHIQEVREIVENPEQALSQRIQKISRKHGREARRIVNEIEQITGFNYWITLQAHSLDYTEALGLTVNDLQKLCEFEQRLNNQGQKGIYSLMIKGLSFILIASCDSGANYNQWQDSDSFSIYKTHFFIMAYCETLPKINISNQQLEPWSEAARDFEFFCQSQSDDYEDCDCEYKPWANIVPEKWHNLIMAELKRT